ncbi:MAG TPA: S-adenosylmethionine:tRNA ribosyltransferase-isomerase [Jiangellaceae bacterium]|jgi:S-adenosylmethionine:tRNA ribosyltransferase-isomerase|nr:S-adenosylmethionine:tRNA ribosyltransferase-isomerase [Jiangellaceae bacterium]
MTVEEARPVTRFAVPPGSDALAPPERRGVPRDGVRLLVARPGFIEHRRFHDLPDFLSPGDLVVVNTSATLPAAVDGRRANGRRLPVHISTALDDGEWVVEVRRSDGTGPHQGVELGEMVSLPGRLELRLISPYPDPPVTMSRLWRASVTPPTSLPAYLAQHGRPIRYSYLRKRFPLVDYQTVFATDPGSAEMPSAGRPFTAPLVVRLVTRGVVVAPVVLHAGVSSPEAHEPPTPERFRVSEPTARLVNDTRSAGGRVVAVGTTVVRALESAAAQDGTVRPTAGWTDLVLGPDRPARTVTGLVTGLHAPEASHLLLLEAVAGPGLVDLAYQAAVDNRYLWHEFGDATLFLP